MRCQAGTALNGIPRTQVVIHNYMADADFLSQYAPADRAAALLALPEATLQNLDAHLAGLWPGGAPATWLTEYNANFPDAWDPQSEAAEWMAAGLPSGSVHGALVGAYVLGGVACPRRVSRAISHKHANTQHARSSPARRGLRPWS